MLAEPDAAAGEDPPTGGTVLDALPQAARATGTTRRRRSGRSLRDLMARPSVVGLRAA
jgi:hypothetical protein